MKKYIIMPEGCRWSETTATSAEMAYRGACCWYSPRTRIAVRDAETGETAIFTRRLDNAGNLLEVVQE